MAHALDQANDGAKLGSANAEAIMLFKLENILAVELSSVVLGVADTHRLQDCNDLIVETISAPE